MPITFVHLSDIHFRRYKNGAYDVDQAVRHELVLSAEKEIEKSGNVAGVIVSGDVAFSGKASEYQEALEWLDKLTTAIKIPSENIWTIPGNHDIDRSAIDGSILLQTARRELRPSDPKYVDAVLTKWLSDPEGDLLFSPLREYNAFARRYGCITTREKMFWQQQLKLNDGSFLCLRGVNSVLASSVDDNNTTHKLVVGTGQSTLLREPGVIYMVLCHHPQDWIFDADTVMDGFNAGATLQLFGHKHRQRIYPSGRSLCIHAGAVNPAISEAGWLPRYNIFNVEVSSDTNGRHLRVEVWPYMWRDDRRQFAPEADTNGHLSEVHTLKLDEWAGENITSTSSVSSGLISPAYVTSQNTDDVDRPEGGVMNPKRRLLFRFFSLGYAQFMRIASTLNLIADEDAKLNDTERLQTFYKRAQERDILAELWNEVARNYPESQGEQNPFQPTRGV